MDLRRVLIDRGVRLAALAACGLALAAAAQRLPANPPTSAANQGSVAPPIAATPTGQNPEHHHRARVTYANGMLDVRADNSSLNQILREISRDTGMKIIGGVADQRVFGNYGPAPAGTVLQTLLDGTNTNMLLEENAVTREPQRLVLTPRTGGVTPPGPSSATYDATETEPEMPLPVTSQPAAQPQRPPATPTAVTAAQPVPSSTAANTTPPPSMPQPANNVLGNPNNVSPTPSTLPVTNSIPVSSLPTPSTATPVSGIVDAPNPPPATSTTAGFTARTPPDNNPNTAPMATSPATTPPTATQTSPGNAKTPAEVYQELLQLQQQKSGQQNPQANPQGSSAPQ